MARNSSIARRSASFSPYQVAGGVLQNVQHPFDAGFHLRVPSQSLDQRFVACSDHFDSRCHARLLSGLSPVRLSADSARPRVISPNMHPQLASTTFECTRLSLRSTHPTAFA